MKVQTKWCIFFIAMFALTIAGGSGCAVGAVALFKGVPLADPILTALHVFGGIMTAIWGLGFVIAFFTLILFIISTARDAAEEMEYQNGN